MGSKEEILQELRGDGVVESGVFTIDVAAARAKMAKFQLPEPEMFILKFVQAADQAARKVEVRFGPGSAIQITFHDWDPELGLEYLGQRFCSIFDHSFSDAAGCLTIGLNTLLASFPEGIKAQRFDRAAEQGEALEISEQWALEETSRNLPGAGYLSIFIPSGLDLSRVEHLLRTRCAYCRKSLTLNGQRLFGMANAPLTEGEHRSPYFKENRLLGQLKVGGFESFRVPDIGSQVLVTVSEENDPHQAWMLLGVDLDPTASIYLIKSGVLVDKKRLDFQIPGLLAVVEASELETDFTGLQIREDEDYWDLIEFVDRASLLLLVAVRDALHRLASETQTTDGEAPMHPVSTTLSFATLGACLTSFAWTKGALALILLGGFWLWTPLVAVSSGWVLGYGRNEKSDRLARESILKVLEQAIQSRQGRSGSLRPD